MRRVLRGVFRLAAAVFLTLATVVLVRAFDARRLGPLAPWHTTAPPSELRAWEIGPRFTLPRYLEREEAVFREVREKVEERIPLEEREAGSRYTRGGPLSPATLPRDWNRTFELEPEEVRGGVLLLHGLTDSPYSMRRLAEIYRDLGYYALALRLPGHGTVPAGLDDVSWRDWAAAVRMGARHVALRTGGAAPFHVVGFSNGGALALDYALDVARGEPLPRPDRLVLVSPMVGVTPAAAVARVLGVLSVLPYFETSGWLDVMPEFIPFKYSSFPVNGAVQSVAVTRAVQKKVRRAAKDGTIAALPPVLGFVSLVDATVRTEATVRAFYDRLGENGSELVVFDLNRSSDLRPFLRRRDERLLGALLPRRVRPYRLTIVTNAAPDTLDVVERSVPAGARGGVERPLGLAWPRQIYSLSHVALPFPPDDPLYGGAPASEAGWLVRLGTLQPRGERAVLSVPADQLTRLTWNPFFPYLEERLRDFARLAP